jgi:hypothetical protein
MFQRRKETLTYPGKDLDISVYHISSVLQMGFLDADQRCLDEAIACMALIQTRNFDNNQQS